jgi:hypothetical protein
MGFLFDCQFVFKVNTDSSLWQVWVKAASGQVEYQIGLWVLHIESNYSVGGIRYGNHVNSEIGSKVFCPRRYNFGYRFDGWYVLYRIPAITKGKLRV